MAHKQYDPSKLLIVPIEQVICNSWNPKDKETKEYRQVVRSLELNGFRQPILVRNGNEPNTYEILDGEQRYTAATEIGYSEVPIYNLGDVSDKEAKAATIWMEVQVPFNEVDLSHLVVELHDLNVPLPYTDAEIENFTNMAAFSFDEFEGDENKDFDGNVKTLNLKLGEEAYDIVMKAINHVKDENDCSDARAIELIAADYLAGVSE